jgi:hypothetical protein
VLSGLRVDVSTVTCPSQGPRKEKTESRFPRSCLRMRMDAVPGAP